MGITERQKLRKQRALEMHSKYKDEKPQPQWIGQLWNTFRAQARAFGSSQKEAVGAADQVTFKIPESDEG